ncbi:Bacterial Ig-like domain (group 2) [compost metagenome]
MLTLTDSSGETKWTQNYGVQGKVISVEQSGDGGYLIGTTRGAIKTDESGNLQWLKTDVDRVIRVVQTQDGGVILLTEYGIMMKLSTPSALEQIRSLTFDSDSYSLSAGQTLDTVVTAVYSTGDQRNVSGQVIYTSVDPAIVAIDSEGNITGLSHGETVITANYSGLESSATVYVYGTVPQVGLLLDSEDYSLIVGQTLDFVVTYIRGNNSFVVTSDSIFTVGDSSILSVDQDGNLLGLRKGRTTLTAAYNGLEVSAIIDVY